MFSFTENPFSEQSSLEFGHDLHPIAESTAVRERISLDAPTLSTSTENLTADTSLVQSNGVGLPVEFNVDETIEDVSQRLETSIQPQAIPADLPEGRPIQWTVCIYGTT